MVTWRSEYHSCCVREKQLREATLCSEFTWLLSSPRMENFQGCALRRMLYHSPDWHGSTLQLQGRAYKRGNLQKQAAAQTPAPPIPLPHYPTLLCRLGCSAAAPWVWVAKKMGVFSTECILSSRLIYSSPTVNTQGLCTDSAPQHTHPPPVARWQQPPQSLHRLQQEPAHEKPRSSPGKPSFPCGCPSSALTYQNQLDWMGGISTTTTFFPTLILLVSWT